jgi:hypothetical protein
MMVDENLAVKYLHKHTGVARQHQTQHTTCLAPSQVQSGPIGNPMCCCQQEQ